MNRLSTTMITQVKEIMLKGPSNALEENLSYIIERKSLK